MPQGVQGTEGNVRLGEDSIGLRVKLVLLLQNVNRMLFKGWLIVYKIRVFCVWSFVIVKIFQFGVKNIF